MSSLASQVGLASGGVPHSCCLVSSEDWVLVVGASQAGLAPVGASSVSSLTGVELFGGLATVGIGWHSANDCQAARSSMQDRGAHSSELAWRFAAE